MNRGPAFGIPPEPPEPPATTRAPKTTEGPEWDAVRKALLVPENCYAKNMEFCVRDLDFINPAIQEVLDSGYDGLMPKEPEKIAEVTNSARLAYTAALQTPDGRRRIEALIEARFRKPVVTEKMDGQSVTLDLGHLPGKLSLFRYSLYPGYDHLENGYWKSTELAKALKDAIDAYPRAESIALTYEFPSATEVSSKSIYVYNKRTNKLSFVRAKTRGAQVTDELGRDFAPYISGQKSLYETLKWTKSREYNW